MKDNNIRALVDAKRSGKRVAALDFIADNPEIPAVLSKLVKGMYPVAHDQEGNRKIQDIDQTSMREASNYISQKSKDADMVMELFPEMELAAQILISSVISPKDMNSTEVSYTLPPNLKVSVIQQLLMPVIKEHFEKSYKIEPLLSTILQDMLFGSGSYPIAVIPENSVDQLINGDSDVSTESVKELAFDQGTFKPIGILGSSNKENVNTNFSLENLTTRSVSSLNENDTKIVFKNDINNKIVTLENISVTDNFNGLKMPKIIQRVREQSLEAVIADKSIGLESIYNGFNKETLNDVQLSGLFYKNRTGLYKNIVKVKTDEEVKRESIGEPLILKLPSESVIPVYTPGNEQQHIGYFVLIDSEGNPVSRNSVTASEADLRTRLGQNSDMNSYLLERAQRNFKTDCDKVTFRQASRVYADIIEADLLARLRNGIIGPVASITKNEEVYRIMLARTLMKQNTQLLYIPDKLITYFALRYDEYGVGESLLDKMRNLNSLRAMLLFAKTMAQVKNSIGRSKVTIKLDPQDPNPQKTIETAMHEVMKTRQQGMPLGINTAADLVDWVQKAGVEFGFEGHPGLPDASLEFSEHSTNYTEPSNDLSDDLRKSSIMATGLSPETVDNGFQADFATTVVANNLLLSKRVKKIQEAFVPKLTDHCRKVVLHNAYVVDQVKNVIRENYDKVVQDSENDPIIEKYKVSNKDLLIHLLTLEFLSNFEVGLSQPDTIVIKNQLEAFEAQEGLLDRAVSYYISSNMLPSSLTGENAGQRIDEIKEVIKAHFMRQWMQENNVLPELSQLGATDDQGQPILDFGDIYKSYINGMTKSVINLLRGTVPVAQAADSDIEKLTAGQDLGESAAPAPSSTSSDTDTDTGNDDFGGGDDVFGGGDDGLPDLNTL